MSGYLDEIVRAAEARHLDVSRVNDNATRVIIPAQPNWLIEVLVPDSLLEWVISLKDEQTGEDLHSDWCDHYQSEGESQSQLQREMRDAVLGFIEAVHNRELRLTQSDGIRLLGRSFFATQRLEAHTDGADSWQDVWALVWPEQSRGHGADTPDG